MAEEVHKLMMAATRTTAEILGIMEDREDGIKYCQESPKEIQEL